MKITLSEVEERKACGPGAKWFAENHADGVDLDSLVEELREKGIEDWIGWLAFSLDLKTSERIALARKAGPKACGTVALKAKGMTEEERLNLLKESDPSYVGLYIKSNPGSPAWLLDYCNDAWKRKIERMVKHGVLKLG